jgi:hypothetical protein
MRIIVTDQSERQACSGLIVVFANVNSLLVRPCDSNVGAR